MPSNLKKLLAFRDNEPAIRATSTARFTEALTHDREHIDSLWRKSPHAGIRAQRGLEAAMSLDPHTAWLARQHIEQARDRLDGLLRTVKDPLPGITDADRCKFLVNLPENARDRLDPAFKALAQLGHGRGFEQRFANWALDYRAGMPPLSHSKAHYPYFLGEFEARLPALEELFTEMLTEFSEAPGWG